MTHTHSTIWVEFFFFFPLLFLNLKIYHLQVTFHICTLHYVLTLTRFSYQPECNSFIRRSSGRSLDAPNTVPHTLFYTGRKWRRKTTKITAPPPPKWQTSALMHQSSIPPGSELKKKKKKKNRVRLQIEAHSWSSAHVLQSQRCRLFTDLSPLCLVSHGGTLSTTTITNSSDPLSCPYHLPHQRLYKPLTSICHSRTLYHLVIGRTSGIWVDKKKKKKRKEPKHVRSHLAEWQPEMAHHIRPKQWVTGRAWDERRRKVNAPFLLPTSEHHMSDR